MRKSLGFSFSVIMALALVVVAGCSFLQSAKDFVCNPTAAEQQEAATALTALDAVQTAAAMVFPEVAIVKASNVLKAVASGGCFLISELETALGVLDGATTQAKTLGVKALSTDFPALRKRIAKK